MLRRRLGVKRGSVVLIPFFACSSLAAIAPTNRAARRTHRIEIDIKGTDRSGTSG